MAVIRVNKTADYTVISNTHFKEKGMSLKAKGLLSMMLSLPDDWDYSIAGLVTLSKDGKDSVVNALTELEEFGYLKRTRLTNEKGQFAGYDYDIYEKPQQGKPYAEKPHSEKPPQLNTNKSSTKKLSTKEKKKERKNTSYDEILSTIADDSLRELYLEYIKMRKLIKSPMTDRALTMLIHKVNDLEPDSIARQKQLLETAIMNNWKSVYPLKDEGSKKQQQETKRYGGTYL
jgi:hypothetical protein